MGSVVAARVTAVMAIAAFNLALGLVVGVALRRGWLSRFFPGIFQRFTPETMVSPPADIAAGVADIQATAAAETGPEASGEREPPAPRSASEMMDRVASDLEGIEQRLQGFLGPVQGPGCTQLQQRWLQLKDAVPRQFRSLAAEAESLSDTALLSPDAARKIARVLESLWVQFEDLPDADPTAAKHDPDVIRSSATRLADACREARGAVNAMLFSQFLAP
jgi:hypothetical protein